MNCSFEAVVPWAAVDVDVESLVGPSADLVNASCCLRSVPSFHDTAIVAIEIAAKIAATSETRLAGCCRCLVALTIEQRTVKRKGLSKKAGACHGPYFATIQAEFE